MPVFPLERKVDSYKTIGPCKFGAPRGGGVRKHAGVDLSIAPGSNVVAIAAGEVIEATNDNFFVNKDKGINTGVVTVKHGKITIGEIEYDEFVVRYGEVNTVSVTIGATVKEGDILAKVAKQADEGTELHMELYLGSQGITSATKFRSDKAPYKRAFTPSDPAPLLDGLEVKK